MVWVQDLQRRFQAFLRDDRGNAGLEFVTTLPLLMGVMVFTAEYGQALRARMALDSAVQDIARYLARAPMDNTTVANGTPTIDFYPGIEAAAQALLQDRIDPLLAFEAETFTVDAAEFRDPYYVIEVKAWTYVEMPLLSIINIFSESPSDNDRILSDGESGYAEPNPLTLVMESVHVVRWGGGAVPGSADCLLADRYRGLCP
ncbi:MAG: TadE/TadG family type IV pilus assembly protein [Pseudomonadota bacterium]